MINALKLRMMVGVPVMVAVLAATVPVLAAEDEHSKVLGSVHVEPGEHTGDATTVNGSVEIGANAVVKRAQTVNGSITMHPHATAESLETVNGSTRLEQGARVTGNVELVNGHISLDREADVTGHLTNVNGSIQLTSAHVGGGIETTTGDINVGPDSRVEGGILVDESNGGWFSFGTPKVPQVVISPGAVIKGTLRFRSEVKLYVSDRATIGAVEGAKAIRFSGDKP